MKRFMVMAVIGCIAASAAPLDAGEFPFFAFRKQVAGRQADQSFDSTTNRLKLTAQPTTAPRLLTVPASATLLQVPPPAPGVEGTDSVAPLVPPAPGGSQYEAPYVEPEPVELFPFVKYEDLDNIHPCAVTKIVAVKDPRPICDHCTCCQPGYVFIQICVPPTECAKFEVKRRDYSKVEWDYGKYEVEVTSKNGIVYVDYDD